MKRAFAVASEQQIKDSDDLFTHEIERIWEQWKTICGNTSPFKYKYIQARLRNESSELQEIPTRWTLEDKTIELLIKKGSETIKAQDATIGDVVKMLESSDEAAVCRRSGQ